jgi:hypothetical protein
LGVIQGAYSIDMMEQKFVVFHRAKEALSVNQERKIFQSISNLVDLVRSNKYFPWTSCDLTGLNWLNSFGNDQGATGG